MPLKQRLRRLAPFRAHAFGVVAGLLVAGALAYDQLSDGPAAKPIELQELVAGIDDGTVAKVELPARGGEGIATFGDGARRSLHLPTDVSWLARRALDHKVAVTYSGPSSGGLLEMLVSLVTGLLPLGFLLYLSRTMGSGGGGAGWSWVSSGDVGTRFSDVAGADDAKEAMQDVVAFLKDPGAFETVGARARCGVLMTGDPGNGKTLLARATAGEAGVGFLSVKGSELGGIIVGAGARRIRKLFEKARENQPCIVFVDEIDAIAGRRYEGGGGAATDNTQSVAQLLTELDGMSERKGVVVIGATNRPDSVDPAVLRPGRFDLVVDVAPPNLPARTRILELNAAKVRTGPDLDLARLAHDTIGMSGAELAALVNEAAILAAKARRPFVTMADCDDARLTRSLGGRAGTTPLTAEEVDVVSVHEAGHAYAACALEHCDPVRAATIAPRGRAMGFVASSPEAERRLVRRAVLEDRIVMCLAGRAAEEVVHGADMATDGAASDMEQALRLADAIVTRFGLKGTFDPCVAGTTSGPRDRPVSDAARAERDEEVRRIVRSLGEEARALVRDGREAVLAIAARLREAETIDGDEVRAIVGRHASGERRAAAE